MGNLTNWRDVDVWNMETGTLVSTMPAQRALLAEYKATGGIAGHVLMDPAGFENTPEDIERLCEVGPAVDEIDWTGFAD